MTIANGVVYMNGLKSVVAIQNGKRLWRYQVPGDTQNLPTVQVSGTVVYLATNANSAPYTENAIYALNAHTGQELWQYHSSTSLSQLTSDQTLLYFSTRQDVGAVDSTTGRLQWQYQFSDGSPYSPSVPSLVATSGHLYLALWTSPYRAGTSLMAFDGRTGTVQWQMQEVRSERILFPSSFPPSCGRGGDLSAKSTCMSLSPMPNRGKTNGGTFLRASQ